MARVLVVDDDEDFRDFVVDSLEYAGHEVKEVGDAQTALSLLRKQSFHVMVTDFKMPGMTGMELLKQVRGEQPELEVLMMTAHGAVQYAVEAMRLGAFDYLEKPIKGPDELRLLVSRAAERRALRDSRESRDDGSDIRLTWGAPAMRPVLAALRKVARTDATVMLLGESGVGKEVAARAVHQWSPRASSPLVTVNCAAFSDTLLESEFFGHERGAFTGAVKQRRGRLELADGGTFFLDEIGELKLDLQAKLLRVIQEKEFERVGGDRTITADVRWIAATNRDLPAMIRAGTFREDLYHRLCVFPIPIPPLRERREDILPLAAVLLQRIGHQLGRSGLRLDESFREAIRAAPWPGNVRELANTLERAVILADGPVLSADALVMPPSLKKSQAPDGSRLEGTPTQHPVAPSPPRSLQELERGAIIDALQRFEGNRRMVADALGIGQRTLYDKIKKYELDNFIP